MTTLHTDPPVEPSDNGQPIGPDHCRNCGGAHFIQRCPEIWQALRGSGPDFGDPPPRPSPQPTPPPPQWDGAAIANAFHKQYNRFVATLLTLDVITRAKWAVAYAEYMNARHTLRTPLTAAHMLRVWDKAMGRDVYLPPRAA